MKDEESFIYLVGLLIISITIGNIFVKYYGFLVLGSGLMGWSIISMLIRKFWK